MADEKRVLKKDPVKIKYLKAFPDRPVGFVAEVHSALADKLVKAGKAELVKEKAEKKEAGK